MTVFTSYHKSPWTWDFKKDLRIGFSCINECKESVAKTIRRERRLAKKKKTEHRLWPCLVISESSNNPQVSIKQ